MATIDELQEQIQKIQAELDQIKEERITLAEPTGTEFDIYAFPFAMVFQMKKLTNKTNRWGWFFKDDKNKIVLEISHRGLLFKGKRIA